MLREKEVGEGREGGRKKGSKAFVRFRKILLTALGCSQSRTTNPVVNPTLPPLLPPPSLPPSLLTFWKMSLTLLVPSMQGQPKLVTWSSPFRGLGRRLISSHTEEPTSPK